MPVESGISNDMPELNIHIISDSMRIFAFETLAKITMSHFSDASYHVQRYPNVNSPAVVKEIIQDASENLPSIVVHSTTNTEVRDAIIMNCLNMNVMCMDCLSPYLQSFGSVLGTMPILQANDQRVLNEDYFRRIHAMEFAINNDDGKSLRSLEAADIVLIGVSRTSKTPLSVYLAYFNYKVINIPLVPESGVPENLFRIPSKKVVGLTIGARRLNEIRSERNETMGVTQESTYADMNNIIEELEFADSVMKRIGCPVIDVSNKAVEETAELIMNILQKKNTNQIL